MKREGAAARRYFTFRDDFVEGMRRAVFLPHFLEREAKAAADSRITPSSFESSRPTLRKIDNDSDGPSWRCAGSVQVCRWIGIRS
jgi:hypothetical protein